MWPFKRSKTLEDRVWMDRGRLYCRFSATGKNGWLNSMSPATGKRLDFSCVEKEGAHLLLCNEQLVESFANAEGVRHALDRVTQALRNDGVRARRAKGLLFIGLPVLGLFLIGSAIGGKSPRPAPAGFPMPAVTPPMGATGGVDYQELLKGKAPMDLGESPADLRAIASNLPAKLDLKAIEKLDKIQFGQGKPAIYVFSDPTCPACKQLDPVLQSMGQPYAIIPVAIKGEEAAVAASRIMCAKDPAKAWRDAMADNDTPLETSDRKELAKCAQKIINNMLAFRSMGLMGTPTLVNAVTGKPMMPNSNEDVMSLVRGK